MNHVANHLWQSTAVVLAIGVLCVALRSEAARIRYWLWLIASIKFLVPFALLSALFQPVSDKIPVAIPQAWAATVAATAQPVAIDDSAWLLGIILGAIWLTGAFLLLGRWLDRTRYFSELLRQGRRNVSRIEQLNRSLPLHRTDTSIEPAVFGIINPVLLLPHGLEHRLTPQELEAVLAHEICHVKRRDNLTAAIHKISEVLFWFYPLTWWIGKQLIKERERACDEMVVAAGHDNEIYARGILNTCALYTSTPPHPAAGISGGNLKSRVVHIMKIAEPVRLNSEKKVLLTLSAFCLLSIPMITSFASNAAIYTDIQSCFAVQPGTGNLVRYRAPAKSDEIDGYMLIEQVPDRNVSLAPDYRLLRRTVVKEPLERSDVRNCGFNVHKGYRVSLAPR